MSQTLAKKGLPLKVKKCWSKLPKLNVDSVSQGFINVMGEHLEGMT